LKQWISLYPEKIMSGSDAFPIKKAVGLYLHHNATKLYGAKQ
jgi:hypothetical protein